MESLSLTLMIPEENMNDYIETLENEFKHAGNDTVALQQKAYMRDKFEFFGLTAPVRRDIQKPFLVKKSLPEKKDLGKIIKTLWEKPQREYQMFSLDLAGKYVKQIEKKDIELFEYMVTHKSWWDTVDMVANHLMGAYFKLFPEERAFYVKKWIQSDNIWLQRSALLFQLKYKAALDTELLSYGIHSLLGSNEFFINKAIGWVLREYSKTNPDWVIEFADATELSSLSKKEALRLIK
jgi:3-methyladenine DNA glycosylase AlkD